MNIDGIWAGTIQIKHAAGVTTKDNKNERHITFGYRRTISRHLTHSDASDTYRSRSDGFHYFRLA
ncbi:hypothetical protein AGABI1DRAFT_111183, partial [Agaricus bisporus var. burnettii JB137-S8]